MIKRKAEACNDIRIINKKTKSQDQNHDIQNQHGTAVVTREFELPDLVVSQVLLLLPTKLAVRASILSRQWERVWSSIPVLVFNEYEEPGGDWHTLEHKLFVDFLKKCLKRREKDKYTVDKLTLHMRYGGGRGSTAIIDKWTSFAVERNIKEIDIILKRKLGPDKNAIYKLSQTILNAKSLTTLNLENVRIVDNMSCISLPSLESMSLTTVVLSKLGFIQLISGCPSIEYLSLNQCRLKDDVKISSLSIKSLKVVQCSIVGMEIEAMNLEYFLSCYTSMSKINIASCQTLRNLNFSDRCLEGAWFEHGLDSRFPLLESLTMNNCIISSSIINVDNQQLKHIALYGYDKNVAKVTLSTPNLLSFELSTAGYLSSAEFSTLVSNFSISAPKLLEAMIIINFDPIVDSYSSSMRKFLGNFDCSRKLNLSVNAAQALIFSEETRKTCQPPLPTVEHLEVQTYSSADVKEEDLGSSLEWLAPTVDSLRVTVYEENEIFTHAKLMKADALSYIGLNCRDDSSEL
ncbi:unnamed protein product [Malus baccata var. baccata]